MGMKKNHLAFSLSPYLLQHQYNPVDWYPWGEEALKKARDEDKPIFLSIGYSACHWCHVMERESFEDPQIAKLLNEYFINIKVDREERPDLDHLYMSCVQAMTGQGGWPLSVFMTPELKPFFAGTYFPPTNLYGMPSFRSFLLHIMYAWRNNRSILMGSSEKVFEYLRQEEKIQQELRGPLSKEILESLVVECEKDFDPEWGGFGQAPKFPQTGVFFALLRQYHHQKKPKILEMVTRTLLQMAKGGIYDQLGGGFHRYSVDSMWLVPHFEKMLYDNALLSRLYLETYQVTGQKVFLETALQTLDYLIKQLRHPSGGFYSAEDADSEGEEGIFYLWTLAQIEEILPDPKLFCRVYGVTKAGNFEEKNILVQSEKVDTLTMAEQEKLAIERKLLLEARSRRVRPDLDEAILVDWNSLAISSLAKAYQNTSQSIYLEAAQKAAQFIESNMIWQGELYHLWRQKLGETPGFLDDYANYILALTDLYECDFNVKWLARAKELLEKMVELFWDAENGAFYSTSAQHNSPLLRTKTFNDDALPSGNAQAAIALMRMSCYYENHAHYQMAEKVLFAHAIIMPKAPQWYGTMLCAVDQYFSSTQQILIHGNKSEEKIREFLQIIYSTYLPHKVVAISDKKATEELPFCQGKPGNSGDVYVCYQGRCIPPTSDAGKLSSLLREKS